MIIQLLKYFLIPSFYLLLSFLEYLFTQPKLYLPNQVRYAFYNQHFNKTRWWVRVAYLSV